MWTALVVEYCNYAALTLALAPVNSAWFNIANEVNSDFREEIGWPELVATRLTFAIRYLRKTAPTWVSSPRTMGRPER